MATPWQIQHFLSASGDEQLKQVCQIESQLFDDAWTLSSLQSVLQQFGAGLLFLTDNHGKMLGYCVYQILFETAEVLRIGTSLDYQGQGVGKALLGEFIGLCQDKSVSHILLEVRADNTAAIGLYQGFGFEQIDRRKHYYRTKKGQMDALILQKVL